MIPTTQIHASNSVVKNHRIINRKSKIDLFVYSEFVYAVFVNVFIIRYRDDRKALPVRAIRISAHLMFDHMNFPVLFFRKSCYRIQSNLLKQSQSGAISVI